MEETEKQAVGTLQPEGEKTRDPFALAALLILVGGFLAAYTYICRGGVIANGQTGNMAKMGMAIVDGDLLEFFRRAVPITAFILGISFAMLIQRRIEKWLGLSWRQWVLLVEILALLAVSFIPTGRIEDFTVNAIVAFICAIQFETFRKFNGNAFASAFSTGNLRSAIEGLNRFFVDHSPRELGRALGYFALIVFFILGSSLGALGTRLLGIYATLPCCGVLAAAFFVTRVQDR